MVRHLVLIAAVLTAASNPAPATTTERSNDGLKVWITRGGSYCIFELTGLEKMRCQSEKAWAKEGVTFSRSSASPQETVTADPAKQ